MRRAIPTVQSLVARVSVVIAVSGSAVTVQAKEKQHVMHAASQRLYLPSHQGRHVGYLHPHAPPTLTSIHPKPFIHLHPKKGSSHRKHQLLSPSL
jgi:hypothetical protein